VNHEHEDLRTLVLALLFWVCFIFLFSVILGHYLAEPQPRSISDAS